jgi:hypothetical protein
MMRRQNSVPWWRAGIDWALRHFACAFHSRQRSDPIARLLRGDSKGPVKTGPHLHELWCAILGLNQ